MNFNLNINSNDANRAGALVNDNNRSSGCRGPENCHPHPRQSLSLKKQPTMSQKSDLLIGSPESSSQNFDYQPLFRGERFATTPKNSSQQNSTIDSSSNESSSVNSSDSSDSSSDDRERSSSKNFRQDLESLRGIDGVENPEDLSDYELLRLRNIQRNEARMAQLGLLGGFGCNAGKEKGKNRKGSKYGAKSMKEVIGQRAKGSNTVEPVNGHGRENTEAKVKFDTLSYVQIKTAIHQRNTATNSGQRSQPKRAAKSLALYSFDDPPSSNTRKKDWHQRYSELKQFQLNYGPQAKLSRKFLSTASSLSLHNPTSHYQSLLKWMENQRTQYRLFEEGGKSSLDESKAELLKALGLHWLGIRSYKKRIGSGSDRKKVWVDEDESNNDDEITVKMIKEFDEEEEDEENVGQCYQSDDYISANSSSVEDEEIGSIDSFTDKSQDFDSDNLISPGGMRFTEIDRHCSINTKRNDGQSSSSFLSREEHDEEAIMATLPEWQTQASNRKSSYIDEEDEYLLRGAARNRRNISSEASKGALRRLLKTGGAMENTKKQIPRVSSRKNVTRGFEYVSMKKRAWHEMDSGLTSPMINNRPLTQSLVSRCRQRRGNDSANSSNVANFKRKKSQLEQIEVTESGSGSGSGSDSDSNENFPRKRHQSAKRSSRSQRPSCFCADNTEQIIGEKLGRVSIKNNERKQKRFDEEDRFGMKTKSQKTKCPHFDREPQKMKVSSEDSDGNVEGNEERRLVCTKKKPVTEIVLRPLQPWFDDNYYANKTSNTCPNLERNSLLAEYGQLYGKRCSVLQRKAYLANELQSLQSFIKYGSGCPANRITCEARLDSEPAKIE